MSELKRLFGEAFDSGVQLEERPLHSGFLIANTPEAFWSSFAKRPPMYYGESDTWCFRCFLQGTTVGGDWLGLAPLPGAVDLVGAIEAYSQSEYGTPWAAYRFCSAAYLLEKAGLDTTIPPK